MNNITGVDGQCDHPPSPGRTVPAFMGLNGCGRFVYGVVVFRDYQPATDGYEVSSHAQAEYRPNPI